MFDCPTAAAPSERARNRSSRSFVARAGLALAVAAVLWSGPLAAQDWRTVSSMRQRSGEDALHVDVQYGAGHLTLMPAAGRLLYRSVLRYDAELFDPSFSYNDGRLTVGFETARIRGRNLEAGQLDLALATGVPLDLDLKFGAAEARLELGGLSIREAHISTGASQTELTVSRPNPLRCSLTLEVGAADFTARDLGNLNVESLKVSGGVGKVTLDFGGEWRSNMDAEVDMGLGALVLRVPRGIGVRVRKRGILASFNGSGLTRDGDVYISENWDDAPHHLTVDIEAALGAIRVEWIDGPATAAPTPIATEERR